MYKIIEGLCVKKGISVNQLSKMVGISSSTFTELKSGRTRELSAKNALKIAKFFNVSFEYLKGEQETKNSPEEPKLTEGEEMLLSLFRQIPEERQQAFLEMGRLYSDSLKKD